MSDRIHGTSRPHPDVLHLQSFPLQCKGHSISTFHLGPQLHTPYAWSVSLFQGKCILSLTDLFMALALRGQDRSYLLYQPLNFISPQCYLSWCLAPGTSSSWELQDSAWENGLFPLAISPSANISMWSSPVLLSHYLPFLHSMSAFVYSRWGCCLLVSLRIKFV